MAEDKRVVSVIEASKILGIGKNLCYEAIRRGEIPALRIGEASLGTQGSARAAAVWG